MAAERATAAERMAATGPVVMVGDVLRLGRVGGGSGWLLGLGGDAPAKGSRHGSLALVPLSSQPTLRACVGLAGLQD